MSRGIEFQGTRNDQGLDLLLFFFVFQKNEHRRLPALPVGDTGQVGVTTIHACPGYLRGINFETANHCLPIVQRSATREARCAVVRLIGLLFMR